MVSWATRSGGRAPLCCKPFAMLVQTQWKRVVRGRLPPPGTPSSLSGTTPRFCRLADPAQLIQAAQQLPVRAPASPPQQEQSGTGVQAPPVGAAAGNSPRAAATTWVLGLGGGQRVLLWGAAWLIWHVWNGTSPSGTWHPEWSARPCGPVRCGCPDSRHECDPSQRVWYRCLESTLEGR